MAPFSLSLRSISPFRAKTHFGGSVVDLACVALSSGSPSLLAAHSRLCSDWHVDTGLRVLHAIDFTPRKCFGMKAKFACIFGLILAFA